MHPLRQTLLVTFTLLALGGGVFAVFNQLQSDRPSPAYATLLPTPLPLPDFALLDDTGSPFDRQSLQGEWSLVFFGFTHCPDICPATLQQLAIARNKVLAADNGQAKSFPQIVLISVDPERDSVETMHEYVANFGAGIKGVTGNIDELRKLTSKLGIFFEKSITDIDSYDVAHSAVVLLINPQGEFHALFSAPHNIDDFVHDVPLLSGAT